MSSVDTLSEWLVEESTGIDQTNDCSNKFPLTRPFPITARLAVLVDTTE